MGGDGLRSPPPIRGGKAPVLQARPFKPPVVARTAKALGPGGGGSNMPGGSSSTGGSSSSPAAAPGVGRGAKVGRGKGRRPGRRDPVSRLLNIKDVTGDTAAVVAAVVRLHDDPGARLRQCALGAARRVLPLKPARRLAAGERGEGSCEESCDCRLDYRRLGKRLSTTKAKVGRASIASLSVRPLLDRWRRAPPPNLCRESAPTCTSIDTEIRSSDR